MLQQLSTQQDPLRLALPSGKIGSNTIDGMGAGLVDQSGGRYAVALRADSAAVLGSVDSEDYRHESAGNGFRSVDRIVQDMISGWYGMSSHVFGGRWDGTSSNVTTALDSWSARNAKTRDAMAEYHDKDGDNADELDTTSDEVAAILARLNF